MIPINVNNPIAALIYLIEKQGLTSEEIKEVLISILEEKELEETEK